MFALDWSVKMQEIASFAEYHGGLDGAEPQLD